MFSVKNIFFRTGKSEDLQSMGRGLPGLLNFEIFRLVNSFDVSLSASTLAFRICVRRRHSQEQTVRGLGEARRICTVKSRLLPTEMHSYLRREAVQNKPKIEIVREPETHRKKFPSLVIRMALEQVVQNSCSFLRLSPEVVRSLPRTRTQAV